MQAGEEKKGVTTKLLVKWERVATTLGGLAGFQVFLHWLRCYSIEIVDDVSSMFTDFPFGWEERRVRFTRASLLGEEAGCVGNLRLSREQKSI